MNNIIEEINIKIEANREVLATLPKNNPKNIRLYIEKVQEIKEQYEELKKQILEEMKNRYNKAIKLNPNPEIAIIEDQLKEIEPVLLMLNDNQTSYERMKFDRRLQNIRYYYNKNLNMVNETIYYCIKKFEEVGIKIELKDFHYSKYVRDYMETFFEEMKKGNINSKVILNKFEEIYWKCPDIIVHIELNIRYLYLKHEKEIDKYYERKREEILKGTTEEAIRDKYTDLSKQFIEKTCEDKYGIVNSFFTKEINIEDYIQNRMEKVFEKYIDIEEFKNADDNKLREININMNKLLNSIYEYKNYLKYQYLIEHIRGIYKEKDKEKDKNAYEQMIKEITEKEKEILKLNDKIEGKGFLQKPDESLLVKQNGLILENKNLYRQLEKGKIYEKIYREMKDTTTIHDVLYFISSFYYYLWRCIKEKFEELEGEDIEKQIDELKEFINWPFCSLLNNVEIQDEKNFLFVIKDRYNLLGISITKEQLEADNLELLENDVKKMQIDYYIKKNEIDVEEMKYICDIKKILDV